MARHLFKKKTIIESEEPTVNLTPLIDVVFVILIMFIVVAPILELEKLQLADASSANKDTQTLAKEASLVSIHVFPDDTVQINKIPVSTDRLGDLLLEAKNLHPEIIPQLYYDKRATFGTYQSVKNAVELAGFEELDLILQPPTY
jgi:biopolymer transport protein ExbD